MDPKREGILDMLPSRQKSEKEGTLGQRSMKLGGVGKRQETGRRNVSFGPRTKKPESLGTRYEIPFWNPVPPARAYKLGSFLNSPSSLSSTFLYFPVFLRLLMTRTTKPATRATTTTTMTAMRPLVRRFMENWGGFSSR